MSSSSLIEDRQPTHHCVEEKSLKVVMETGVSHTTVVVEEKDILHIKLVILCMRVCVCVCVCV